MSESRSDSSGRVVVDTSVFVAAGFRPRSHSGRLMDVLATGGLQIVWDHATRAETERVLHKIPMLRWEAVAPLFDEGHRFRGRTDPPSFSNVPDEADRKFAALAAAAGVPLITLDRPLLASGRVPDSKADAHSASLAGRDFIALRPHAALAWMER